MLAIKSVGNHQDLPGCCASPINQTEFQSSTMRKCRQSSFITMLPVTPVTSKDRGQTKDRGKPISTICILFLLLACVGLACSLILSPCPKVLLGDQVKRNEDSSSTDREGTILLPDDKVRRKKAPLPTGKEDGCAAISIPVKEDEWGSREMELLFLREQIPGIAQQLTKRGQRLRSLSAFDGKLHIGFGDYRRNTGPIPMHAWDPALQSWIYVGLIPTEQVEFFRSGPGVLYMPEIDSRGEDRKRASAVYSLTCGSKHWRLMGNPINGSAHNFDLTVQNDKILVTTGSRTNEPAFLVASEDQGVTWTELLRHQPAHNRYARFRFVGATEKVVFVSGREPRSTTFFAWIQRKGQDSFEPITNLNITKRTDSSRTPYLIPVTHRDEMVITAFTKPPSGAGRLLGSYRISGNELVKDDPWPKIGGKQANLVSWLRDLGRLLVLMESKDGSSGIFRTDSLENNTIWETVFLVGPLKGDDHFVSMSVLLNDLYLGTQQGNLYVVRELYKPVIHNNTMRL